MKRAIHLIGALILTVQISALVMSCGEGRDPLNPISPEKTDPDKFCPQIAGIETLADYLSAITAIAEGFTYEDVLSFEVTVADGGSATGSPATWGGDYPFSMSVPPGALDGTAHPESTVTITVKVPVFDTSFPCDKHPMPIFFEPAGLDLLEDATFTASLHPALQTVCTGYDFFYLEPDSSSPQVQEWHGLQRVYGAPLDCGFGIDAVLKDLENWHLGGSENDTTDRRPSIPVCN